MGLTTTDLFERKPEDARLLIDTNLTGPLFSCQIFGRIMAEQGSGSIINIASIAGLVGRDRRMYQHSAAWASNRLTTPRPKPASSA